MVLENLSDRLQQALNKLRGKGKLTEKDVDAAMREVRLALLEADVNYRVVKDFVKTIKERAIGDEVMESLTPGQMVIKIVNEELTRLMGEKEAKLDFSGKPPAVILLAGLQGAGKTTHAGKLARLLKTKHGRQVLLVACDVYRPAAIKQLQVVGGQIDVEVYADEVSKDPVQIAKDGITHAERTGKDLVIIDTAGRLHIDEEMMDEIAQISQETQPKETLLVVDAMTGQDAVNVAKSFNDILPLTGVILTKLDGDTRGGAALSIRSVVEKPIKFIGTGEKLEDLETFYPDRMASRILGMGDVLSLIDRAQAAVDEKQAREFEQKMRNQTYNLNDFLQQMDQVRNMGPLDELLKMIPGVNAKQLSGVSFDDKQIKHVEAMIQSMTMEERERPEIINASRKQRIAAGAGVNVVQLNKLLKQFKETQKMMKKFGIMEKNMKKRGRGGFPFFK